MFFEKKTMIFTRVEFLHIFLEQNAEKSLTPEKTRFLENRRFTQRENDDFQGLPPVQKRYARFLIHIFPIKTHPKIIENRRFLRGKII